jgi:hypothetical protein
MKPVILLFGLSGSGKSTLAAWLVEDLQLVHINFDDWDHLGVDGGPLLRNFDIFIQTYRGERLRAEVMKVISQQHRQGAVLTFPSDTIPTIANLKEAQRESMTPIILFGPKEDCYQAFLEQDQTSGTPLPSDHWPRHNNAAYSAYCRPEYHPYKEEVFPRRTRTDLVQAVQKRMAPDQ